MLTLGRSRPDLSIHTYVASVCTLSIVEKLGLEIFGGGLVLHISCYPACCGTSTCGVGNRNRRYKVLWHLVPGTHAKPIKPLSFSDLIAFIIVCIHVPGTFLFCFFCPSHLRFFYPPSCTVLSRNSDPGPHSRLFSPFPPHYGSLRSRLEPFLSLSTRVDSRGVCTAVLKR